MDSLDCEGQQQSMIQNIPVLITEHAVEYPNIGILKKKEGKGKYTVKVPLKQRINNECAFWPL